MRTLTLFLLSIALLIRCAKDPQPYQNLPDEVNLGESVVYLNGELASNYQPKFQYTTVYGSMSYLFEDSTFLKSNLLGLGIFSRETGRFETQRDCNSNVKCCAGFSQIVDEDQTGYEYKLIDEDEGFLEITAIDTIQRIVKGRFRAKFKRTSKNGNSDLGLPKILLFQGVFHDEYRIQ